MMNEIQPIERVMQEAVKHMQEMIPEMQVSYSNDYGESGGKFFISDGEVEIIDGEIRKAKPRQKSRWNSEVANPNSYVVEFGAGCVMSRPKIVDDRIVMIWDKKNFMEIVKSNHKYKMEKQISQASEIRSSEIRVKAMNQFRKEYVPKSHPNIGDVVGRGFGDEVISMQIGMPIKDFDIKMIGREAVDGKRIMKIVGNSGVSVYKMGNMVANEYASDDDHNKISIPMIEVVGKKQEIIDIINQIYD